MSILVTGGCGLVGARLVRVLAEKGEEVWVLDNRILAQRFSGIESRVKTIDADVANFSKVLEAVKETKPSVIFHLGAMLSLPSHADPQSSFYSNVAGTFHVLEAARLFNIPKLIFASSTATYGLDIQKPVIDDFTLQRPMTFYGATKLFGELLGRFYRTKYGIDFRAIRFPAIIGPGAKTYNISIYNTWAIEKAFYGESFDLFVEPDIRCPLLYFKDAARCLLLLEAAPPEAMQTICYLIAGVQPMVSARELVDEIKKHFPNALFNYKPDPLAMAHHRHRQGVILDESRAEKEWGWKPEYSLEEMIVDFYAELKAHPGRYR